MMYMYVEAGVQYSCIRLLCRNHVGIDQQELESSAVLHTRKHLSVPEISSPGSNSVMFGRDKCHVNTMMYCRVATYMYSLVLCHTYTIT